MNNYLPTDYQNFIALSRYARWKEDEQRRETWVETVDRYFDYMDDHLQKNHNYTITKALKEKLSTTIMSLARSSSKSMDSFSSPSTSPVSPVFSCSK